MAFAFSLIIVSLRFDFFFHSELVCIVRGLQLNVVDAVHHLSPGGSGSLSGLKVDFEAVGDYGLAVF